MYSTHPASFQRLAGWVFLYYESYDYAVQSMISIKRYNRHSLPIINADKSTGATRPSSAIALMDGKAGVNGTSPSPALAVMTFVMAADFAEIDWPGPAGLADD